MPDFIARQPTALVTAQVRTRQPQGVVGIDARFPTRLAYNAATKRDAARNAATSYTGTPLTVISPDGPALRLDNYSNYLNIPTTGRPLTVGPFSFVYRFRQQGSVTNGGSLLTLPGTSANANRIDIYTLVGNTIRADVYNSAAAATTVDTASFINVGSSYTLELCFDGSVLQWYVNGVASGSPVSFTGSRSAESGSLTVGFGAGVTSNHDVSFVGFVSGAVPEVSRNPWQLFAKIPTYAPGIYTGKEPWSPRTSVMMGTSSITPPTAAIRGVTKRVRTRQPQSSVGIDLSASTAAGLKSLVSPTRNICTDLLSAVAPARAGMSNTVTSKGVVASFNGASSRFGYNRLVFNGMAIGTAILRFRMTSFGTQCIWYEAGSGKNNFNINAPASGASVMVVNLNSNIARNTTKASWSLDVDYTVACVWGSDLKIYIDGVLDSTHAVSGGIDTSSSGSAFCTLGSYDLGSTYGQYFVGSIGLCEVLSRQLSATEIKARTEGPWSLFAPVTEPIWSPYP